jgi:hypothetical protein
MGKRGITVRPSAHRPLHIAGATAITEIVTTTTMRDWLRPVPGPALYPASSPRSVGDDAKTGDFVPLWADIVSDEPWPTRSSGSRVSAIRLGPLSREVDPLVPYRPVSAPVRETAPDSHRGKVRQHLSRRYLAPPSVRVRLHALPKRRTRTGIPDDPLGGPP